MSVPSKDIMWTGLVESFIQCKRNIIMCKLCHSKTDISAISSKVIFHRRKKKFDWIEIKRVWRQEFAEHAPVGIEIAY